jgi:hypothetical protein
VSQQVSPSPAPERERSVTDLVVTIVGLAITAVLGLGASVLGLMLVMASDSCGASSECDTNLIGLGVLLAVVAPWVCWVPALVLTIVRQARRRLTWWVPIAGGLAYVPLVVVAFLVINAGVEPTG